MVKYFQSQVIFALFGGKRSLKCCFECNMPLDKVNDFLGPKMFSVRAGEKLIKMYHNQSKMYHRLQDSIQFLSP